MRKLIVVPLIAAVACGGGALKDQARSAMPDKSSVAMGSPQGSSTASATANQSVQDSTAGQPSPFFTMTVTVAAVFNVPVALFLDLIASVTLQEPTSCTATSCTWGPGSGPLDSNSYQLVVSKNSDGISFDWTLSGQVKSRPGSTFVTLASGNAIPGGQAHHGSGKFSIDFDAAATLVGPHDATGLLTITNYTNVGPAQLAVTYVGAKDSNNPAQRNNIVYSYANNTSGGGDLDFAVHNTTTGDQFSAHSRWKNDGEGRADVAGLGSGYNVSLSECWGVAPFTVVYFSSNVKVVAPPWGGPDSGQETACAFVPAAFSTKTAP